MGIGHRQLSFFKSSKFRYCHGGSLRNERLGRKARPLSTKEPLHCVFKINKRRLRSSSLRTSKNFQIAVSIIHRYASRFYIKLEQVSVQNDHIHLLIRTSRRSQFHFFFRVVAGQIAQQFEKEGALIARGVTGTPGALGNAKNQGVTDTLGTHGNKKTTANTGSKGLQRDLKARKSRPPSRSSTDFWMYRPFSRVVRGYRAYKDARDYILLNELEVTGRIKYQKLRLRELSNAEWEILRHFE